MTEHHSIHDVMDSDLDGNHADMPLSHERLTKFNFDGGVSSVDASGAGYPWYHENMKYW